MKSLITLLLTLSVAAGPSFARTIESTKEDLADRNEQIQLNVEKVKLLKNKIFGIKENIKNNSLILEATEDKRNLEVGFGAFAALLPILFGVLPKNSTHIKVMSALTSIIIGLFTKVVYNSHERSIQSQEARLEELNSHLDELQAVLDEAENELKNEYAKNSAILEAL